jgi:hypothetical protein
MSDFALDLRALCEKYKVRAKDVTRSVVLDIGTRIVEKSPVGNPKLWARPAPKGYVGGRFRGNWQYAFNVVPTAQLPDIDASGLVSIARFAACKGEAGVHYIVNNLPYGPRLEFEGWSTQAPSGMVGITVVEWRSVVDKAVKEANP